MLFHSLAYASLLALTLLVCSVLSPHRRWCVLLLSSAAFYVAWRPEYLLLLLLTATSCHFAAIQVMSSPRPKAVRWLAIAVLLNLGILFLFKYYGLFARTTNTWFVGQQTQVLPVDLGFLLPVGISFYTFQAIGYVVDVYNRKVPAEQSWWRTTLFVAFFPQLVAGPIERAHRLLAALRRPIQFRYRNFRLGLWLIAWGLFKKVVIADRLALLVDAAYAAPDEAGGGLLLIATYAFAFQIYCDFSGYTDMAIGSARLFGIPLMQNFRVPYLACGLRDFWARWHISLSTWFRDYVYIPLGGNRVGRGRWAVNILIVFAVSGLWHGAEWTFVVWGLLHGAGVLVESLWSLRRGKHSEPLSRGWRWSGMFVTFHVVLLGWVFFRAESLADAGRVLTALNETATLSSLEWPPGFSRFELGVSLLSLTWMLLLEVPAQGDVTRLLGLRPRWRTRLVVLGTLLLTVNFGIFNHPTQFVYFQF